MANPLSDSDRYRRRQRRRAIIGWGGGLAVIALIALAAILGGEDDRDFNAPYGELMTSAEFEAIGEGEGEDEVLERLGKSGRPERLTEDYVLVLFPPHSEEVSCSYWEFSDELQIFARLCFDSSDGELVQKLARDVHEGVEENEGAVTA